ncbi:MAG: SGNH/GDSL hydrolase family protein [Actinomycetota bacterium]|nr:SGNH/GDSL hydrolase family protein [Actinomycetota bacterium]
MRILWAACLLTAVVACSTGTTSPPASSAVMPGDAGPAIVFVSVGSDETTGEGLPDRLRQAWPQLFFRQALAQRAVHVNLAIPGTTVADALDQQLPSALELAPTVATLWLTSGDVANGTPVSDYERDLETAVRLLQQTGGARVLVALGPEMGSAARATAAYNAAVRRVVDRTDADLVDLSMLSPELGVSAHMAAATAFDKAFANHAGR